MINGKLIKVCGLCHGDDIREIEQMGVDLTGFIFYPKSPRCICTLPDYLPHTAKRVGVFVNQDRETLQMFADRFGLHYFQLHGKESPNYCRALQSAGGKIIKAFSVATPKDLEVVQSYEGACDYFLFDTKTELPGGSGKKFDWSILRSYTGQTPFLLSGGIDPYSAQSLSEFDHPHLAGYDINSRFEIRPGKKDTERIRFFLDGLKGDYHPQLEIKNE